MHSYHDCAKSVERLQVWGKLDIMHGSCPIWYIAPSTGYKSDQLSLSYESESVG